MRDLPTWVLIAGALATGVGTIGGLAGIGTLLRLRAEKRKLGAEAEKFKAEADKVDADAAEKLTSIALGLVEPLQRQLAQVNKRVSWLEHSERVRDRLAIEHSAWDHMVITRGREAGLEFGDAPPLFPPLPPPPATPQSTEVTVAVHTEQATQA